MNTKNIRESGAADRDAQIKEVISLFHQLGQGRMRYQFESWKKLDVPLAQLKSLFIINLKGSVNVRNLAQDLGVTPGNVTSIIDRLVAQGLVERRQSPEDRRIVLLQLTDKGRKKITDIHETGMSHLKRVLARMSPEDISALIRGVRSFIAAIGQDRGAPTVHTGATAGTADVRQSPPRRKIEHQT
jgi:DNA-binding MarR family transcriptional regulator